MFKVYGFTSFTTKHRLLFRRSLLLGCLKNSSERSRGSKIANFPMKIALSSSTYNRGTNCPGMKHPKTSRKPDCFFGPSEIRDIWLFGEVIFSCKSVAFDSNHLSNEHIWLGCGFKVSCLFVLLLIGEMISISFKWEIQLTSEMKTSQRIHRGFLVINW